MARNEQGARGELKKKAEKTTSPKEHGLGQKEREATDETAQSRGSQYGQTEGTQPDVGPAAENAPAPGDKPMSLMERLLIWIQKQPRFVQNGILVLFVGYTLLISSVAAVNAMQELVNIFPKNIPPIQGVIRNEYDLDVRFLKTGDFTIQASPTITGKFDLEPVQAVVAADSNMITVPRKDGEVSVCARIRNARKIYEYYKSGEYPLTLTLATDSRRYIAQIDRFSRAGLKKGWTVFIPSNITTERVIKVCFDELSDSSKSSILQDEANLEDMALLEDETHWFIEDLEDEVERGRFFGMITAQHFRDIVAGKTPHAPFEVTAMVTIGIYEQENGEKKIIWEVMDTRGKMRRPQQGYVRRYSPETGEDWVRKIIAYVTEALKSSYPIEGRICDASRQDRIVEMGIGRLAGVREHMTLHVYCGEISKKKHIGEVTITSAWPGTCEGKLELFGTYPDDAFTSLLVSSRLE